MVPTWALETNHGNSRGYGYGNGNGYGYARDYGFSYADGCGWGGDGYGDRYIVQLGCYGSGYDNSYKQDIV